MREENALSSVLLSEDSGEVAAREEDVPDPEATLLFITLLLLLLTLLFTCCLSLADDDLLGVFCVDVLLVAV